MKRTDNLLNRAAALLLVGLLTYIPSQVEAQFDIPDRTELFRDDIVPRIDIKIDEESLNYILDPENSESDELFEATFIFTTDDIVDTLNQVGFRLRGNTSRNAAKKSFKVDINAFVPGRKFYGVQKINLNGQHNDPTSSRAKICADLADRIGIPSMRTNHVELYINAEYFGLYTNTEHIDQNYVELRFGNRNGNLYKCLYPADLNYKGSNPEAYKEVIFGRRNYELKNNEHEDDYSDFAEFVNILTLTPSHNLACSLEQVFNVDQYLKTIVFDILTGNWDGPIYNKNNFYLYHNQATDQFEYIPYDLDNTLGIDWLVKDWGNRNIYTWKQDDEARPIYTRFMENDEYRKRFSYYMQEVLLTIFNEAELYPYLDELEDRLRPYIADDTYYTLDYGFDVEDFEDGFEFPLGYFQTDYGIKEYIQTRLISAFNQVEMEDMHPVISSVTYNQPNDAEDFFLSVKTLDDHKVEKVYFHRPDVNLQFEMYDNGQTGDTQEGDGIYEVQLPNFFVGQGFEYFIEVIDDVGQSTRYPRCSNLQLFIEEEELSLAINEFMASNNAVIQDELGEYDDWIEIYNYGERPIYLGDKFLTDNPDNKDKWKMPHYTIMPDEYLLFWADDDRNQGTFHTNFKLQKAGEYIGIFDNDETLIDEIEYSAQESDISTGRWPNGTGDFSTMSPTPGNSNIGTSQVETAAEVDISINPNPTSGNIRIMGTEAILQLQILDGMGRKLPVQNDSSDLITLPSTPGIYLIQMKLKSGKIIVHKVVKT